MKNFQKLLGGIYLAKAQMMALCILYFFMASCYNEPEEADNGIFIVKKIINEKNGSYFVRYGLINVNGLLLVGLNYENIALIGRDYFVGEKRKEVQQYFRILDETLLFDKEFEVAKPFSEKGLARVKVKGKWGFINRQGNFIIPPLYDLVGEFSEGLAPILIENKVGFINEHGKIIIDPKYEFPTNAKFNSLEHQIESYRFVHGLCPVVLNSKYGYIDQEDKIKVNITYAFASHFNTELAKVGVELDEEVLYGIIDKTGQWKIEPKFKNIILDENYFIGFFPGVKNPTNPFDFVKSNNISFSYFRYDGSKMIDQIFTDASTVDFEYSGWAHKFSEDKAFICKEGSCGYINKLGNFVIEPKYFSPGDLFTNGMAAVNFTDNQNAIISKGNTKEIVQSYRQVGIIGETGNILIPAVFVYAKIHSGLIEVIPKEYLHMEFLLDKVFYIDYKGNYIWNGYESMIVK